MIKKIGIIGAGTMGSGIASAQLLAGILPYCIDIYPEALKKRNLIF
jgi:3-hydroxyacyl-CoA dehydrogenase